MCCQKTEGRVFLEELLCYHFPNRDYTIVPKVLNNFEASNSNFFFQISGKNNSIRSYLFIDYFSSPETFSGYEINFTIPLNDAELTTVQSWYPPE
ncbi:hypothetical protein FIA58_009115 [Flavobacterium jejuense]|uniref:Uncharacterized protein n=1 Tax=Flavobacterium jejuense TaxID=1544455 RepID=A0ABX0IPT3_9FLAO|nr:hypothetical protein [Flavobacterium jejuense]NHN25832.1 hypothetical protein [Flavobacterium jejuense]